MTTYPVTGPLTLELDLAVGDVRIIASDRDDADVTVAPQHPGKASSVRGAEQTNVTSAGNRLTVRNGRGWRTFSPLRTPDAVDITVAVPTGTAVTGTLIAGSIRADGPLGACNLTVTHADLTVDDVASLTVKSSSGAVSAGHIAGDATVSASYGAVRLQSVAGKLDVKNSYGDISIGVVHGPCVVRGGYGAISVDRALDAVRAKTAHGRTTLHEVCRGSVAVESSYGAIEIGVHDGTAAWLDVDSTHGRFRNELTPSAVPGSDEDRVSIHARTSYGDIVVARTPAPLRKEPS